MTILQPNSEAAGTRIGPHQVFVYGTLKKGFPNHDAYLRSAKFLGQAQVEGIMFHLGAFPAINLGDLYTRILGEVYQVSWDDVLAMDRLEGHPNFYQRIEISVFPFRKAWTYVLPHDKASKEKWIIPSGHWRGPDSPKVAWAGWNKGALVGVFQTNSTDSSILIGSAKDGTPGFLLRKNQAYNIYEMINLKTNEILGTYKNMGDYIREQQEQKPERTILTLPSRSTKAAEEVKQQIYRQAAGPEYNPPPRRTVIEDRPPYTVEPPKPPQEPQAARMLGIKVREA